MRLKKYFITHLCKVIGPILGSNLILWNFWNDGRGWRWTGVGRKKVGVGGGRFFTWRQKQGEEPVGSAGNSHARPSSRKALSAVIHYSATSTISLCQAIFTRSDKIDSMYKRKCNVSPSSSPSSSHTSPLIYLSGTLMPQNGIDVAFIP